MNEIKCPKCGEVFTVDEKSYAAILNDVRGKEFDKEVKEKIEQVKRELDAKNTLLLKEANDKSKEELNELNNKITSLESELKAKDREAKANLELEKEKQNSKEKENLALKDKQIAELLAKLEAKDKEFDMKLALEIEKQENKNKDALKNKDSEIEKLKAEALINNAQNESNMTKALSEKDAEISKLNSLISQEKEDKRSIIKIKDEEIERLRDLKIKLNNKLSGEDLEQHCLNEFNSYRTLFGSNVYFEKDNDDKDGTKGDFIYRETTSDGIEVISIMFEMKNEKDDSVNKHKNEDFFKKLDSDRCKKKCEYAVLVSTLENENEYYNNGIVDVSHKYNKMYVIRPQFFMPLITLLRNAALNTVTYRREIEVMKNEQIDVTNFELKMDEFKSKFGKNYESAKNNFDTAIAEIDKSISHLTKVKESLLTSENQLRLANDKAQDLSIKSLTKDSPSIKQKFEDAKKNRIEAIEIKED